MMSAIQQLSTLETAKSLDITESTVKTRYLRSKRSLQKILEAQIKNTELDVFEFAGRRCDWIVKTVITRLFVNNASN